MSRHTDNPAWQADVHFERIEREHDIAIESLVAFLIKLGCDRDEALYIIREADEMIENGEFDHMIE